MLHKSFEADLYYGANIQVFRYSFLNYSKACSGVYEDHVIRGINPALYLNALQSFLICCYYLSYSIIMHIEMC